MEIEKNKRNVANTRTDVLSASWRSEFGSRGKRVLHASFFQEQYDDRSGYLRGEKENYL